MTKELPVQQHRQLGCFVYRQEIHSSMIKDFRHRGLQAFFESGSKAGIRPDHAGRLARQLTQLNVAIRPEQMNLPGWKFHALSGDMAGIYAVTVNANWRLTFKFEDADAILVDYQDYH